MTTPEHHAEAMRTHTCTSCGGESKFEGRCMACIMVDYEDDYDDNECWNCSGEGYVSNCFEEFACIHPDEGCDLCTRRCDVCNPPKLTPEQQAQRDALRQVLADALKEPAK